MCSNICNSTFSRTAMVAVMLGATAWAGDAAVFSNNVAFCISNNSTVSLITNTDNEFGIVVATVSDVNSTEPNDIVLAANNHLNDEPRSVGQEWTEAIPAIFELSGGSCYNVAMMNKATPPNPDVPWECDMVQISTTPNHIIIEGSQIMEDNLVLQGSITVLGQATAMSQYAPVLNCPY